MRDYQEEQPWLPFSEALLEWDDDFHELMLQDRLRMAAYRKAIQETVRPGDVVLGWAVERMAQAGRVLPQSPEVVSG